MEGGIFLTIKDYMKLTGKDCYNSAQREHLALRSQGKKTRKKKITIKEYCEEEELDFEYVWNFLRG